MRVKRWEELQGFLLESLKVDWMEFLLVDQMVAWLAGKLVK